MDETSLGRVVRLAHVRTSEGAKKYHKPIGTLISDVQELHDLPDGSHITSMMHPTNRLSHGHPIHWKKVRGVWSSAHGGIVTSSETFQKDIKSPDSDVYHGHITKVPRGI